MIEIDGSYGEGGGQILRTALSLSLVTQRPFRMVNIRARRAKPGLMRQHLTAVQAAQQVGNALVKGAAIGSAVLTFEPGPVNPGKYFIQIGTAGSTTLVLQTILPPLLMSAGANPPARRSNAAATESIIRIEGGTHNTLAPPFDFVERSFVPLLNRMGVPIAVSLNRHGFFPAGGGAITAEIGCGAGSQPVNGCGADFQPVNRGTAQTSDTGPRNHRLKTGATFHRLETGAITPLKLLERGRPVARSARALFSRVPDHVAERELAVVRDRLGWDAGELHAVPVLDALGPGNVLMLEAQFEHVTEIVTAFGEKGKPAEQVAALACDEMEQYLATEAPVGPHLADQLLLPMALLAGGAFRTGEPTPHALTNMDVIRRFLEVDIAVLPDSNNTHRIEVHPR